MIALPPLAKKTLNIVALLLIIFLAAGYVRLKTWSVGNDSNFFNKNLRHKFARSYLMRQALGLHNDGDARDDYLGNRYKKIVLEIDSMQGLYLPYSTFDKLAASIRNITGKPVSVIISDTSIPFTAAITSEDARAIMKRYRAHNQMGNKAVFYILVAGQYQGQPDRIGMTLHEDGSVLFLSALQSSSSFQPNTLDIYSRRTLLHEFGHQIGLVHNVENGCLMTMATDFGFGISSDSIVTDFCELEKESIRKNSAE